MFVPVGDAQQIVIVREVDGLAAVQYYVVARLARRAAGQLLLLLLLLIARVSY